MNLNEIEDNGHSPLGLELLSEISNSIPTNASPLLDMALAEKEKLLEDQKEKQEKQKLRNKQIKKQYLLKKELKKIAKKSKRQNRSK